MPDDEVLQVGGRAVKVTNPGKVFFPDADGGPVLPVELGGKPHPCLAELRQERVLLARLLTALRVPIGDEDARSQRRGIRGVYTLGRFDAS